MAFNGSGTFNRNTGVYSGSTAWAQTRNAGRLVRADDHDAHDQDIANGLSNCVTKDGQTAITANLPMSGFRHTNCANAVADTDYTTLGQVKAGIDTYASGLATTATNYQANGVGAYLRLRKSRGAAFPTTTIVQQNDEVGGIAFAAANGTTFDDCAGIQGAIDGVPGATNDMPGRLVFYTKADNSATMSERLRIDSNGNVGIGINAPKDLLQLGNIAAITPTDSAGGNGCILGFNHYYSSGSKAIVTGNRTATVELQNNGGYLKATPTTQTADAALSGMNVYMNWGGVNDLVSLYTANTERMRITSGGNVGIGTVPSYQLHLSTDSAAKLTTNTWTVTSDARVKTNVQPYTKGLAAIKQVNPVSYDYNGKAQTPAGPGGISILAQELQPVFPECIGSYRTKLEPDDEQETELLTYQGHAMIFALINAVKELAARVEVLEAGT